MPDYKTGIITFDGTDSYSVSRSGDSYTFKTAAGNKGGNYRMAVIPTEAPVSVNQTACMTWNHNKNDLQVIQPGIVLRANTAPGRTRLIMVTNNIMFNWRAGINIHLVDTSIVGSTAHHQIAGFNTFTIGDPNKLPWRICAQAIGNTIKVKGWSINDMPEPAWNDPTNVFSTQVPDAWVVAGQPGVYMGHMKPGQTTKVTNVTGDDILGLDQNDAWLMKQSAAARAIGVLTGVNPSSATPEVVDLARRATLKEGQNAATEITMSETGRTAEARRAFRKILDRQGASYANLTNRNTVAYLRILLDSSEFKTRYNTNEKFITQVYTRLLGRNPTASEMTAQTNTLKTKTRLYVVDSILNSTEASNYEATLAWTEVTGHAPTTAQRNAAATVYRNTKDTGLLRAYVYGQTA
jgi:hypothetical protein